MCYSKENNITDRFVDNIFHLANATLHKEVYEHFRDCFLDYMGCAIAGSRLLSEKVDKYIRYRHCAEGACTVLGKTKKLEPNEAAFLNAMSAHVIELDDGHKLGAIHLGAPIFSGLLAVAESESITFGDFLRGAVVGYEAAIRIASSIQPYHRNRGFHTTGTCGTIGVTIAIATALHFSFQEMKTALSCAVSCAGGSNEMMEGQSQLKPFNIGKAAYDGVLSAYVGRIGFVAPNDIIGGKRGFYAIMTDQFDDSYLESFNGSSLLGMTNYFKTYAACRHCHAAIEATLFLQKENKIDPQSIVRINVDMYDSGISGHDHKNIDSMNAAKMSIPYSVAVAILEKKAGLREYDDEHICRKDILSLTQKVFVRENPSLTALTPQKRASIVEIITSSAVFRKRVDSSKGDIDNPMDRDELMSKFMDLTESAGLSLGSIKSLCDSIINTPLDSVFPEKLFEYNFA